MGAWSSACPSPQSSKVLAKRELLCVPVIGWTWYFLEIVFCRRRWEEDRDTVVQGLQRLADYPEYMWVSPAVPPAHGRTLRGHERPLHPDRVASSGLAVGATVGRGPGAGSLCSAVGAPEVVGVGVLLVPGESHRLGRATCRPGPHCPLAHSRVPGYLTQPVTPAGPAGRGRAQGPGVI